MPSAGARALARTLLLLGCASGAQGCVEAHAEDASPPLVQQVATLCDVGYAEVLRELAMYGRCTQDDECVAVPLPAAAEARHRVLIARVESGERWLDVESLGAATNRRWLPLLESSLERYHRRCAPPDSNAERNARCEHGMCVPAGKR